MKIREEEALRYLGAKGAPDEQTSALLRDAATQLDAIATPRHAVLRVRAELSGTRVTLGAFQADCVALAAHLAGCGAAYLFAATLGAEVDRAMARLAKLDVARAFALQACAASARMLLRRYLRRPCTGVRSGGALFAPAFFARLQRFFRCAPNRPAPGAPSG